MGGGLSLKFDLIWSRQTYQHISDIKEIKGSLNYLITYLLGNRGRLIIDNLNFHHFRLLSNIRNIIKKGRFCKAFQQETYGDNFYLKYYLEQDFASLLDGLEDEFLYKITFTETLFHPEFNLIPRSNLVAIIDALLQKTPFARFLGRQISLDIVKHG